MQSFDTKDSNTSENFGRKFESFDTFSTKDSEVKQPADDFVESSDRKVESFDAFSTKASEVEQPDNRVAQSFDRKSESTDEEALPDSESFGTKGTNVAIPSFDNSNTNSDTNEQAGTLPGVCLESQGSEKSKTDGRSKPRSQKQIEAY